MIRKPTDPEIEEWKAFIISMGQNTGKDMIEHESFYSVKFNWENNFYKTLGAEPDFKATQTRLQQIMSADSGWK